MANNPQSLMSRKRLKNVVYPDGSGMRELPRKSTQNAAHKLQQRERQAVGERNVAVKAQPRQQIANKLQPKPSRDVVAAYDRAFKKNAKKTR